MSRLAPLNLKRWVEEHRHLLKPPVGNAQIWKDAEFIVMAIGGPNQRKDYHLDPGEEFFYQIEGEIVLKVVEDGQHKDIPIREGEVFLLPAMVPHSPRRPANTVGMVLERVRRSGELDHFRWYCEQCGELLHDVELRLTDITTQLAPIFEAFWKGDPRDRTCRKCGTVLDPPTPAPAKT